jgi:hypothetical protein
MNDTVYRHPECERDSGPATLLWMISPGLVAIDMDPVKLSRLWFPRTHGVSNGRIGDGQQLAVAHELAHAIAPGVAKATMPKINDLVVRQL